MSLTFETPVTKTADDIFFSFFFFFSEKIRIDIPLYFLVSSPGTLLQISLCHGLLSVKEALGLHGDPELLKLLCSDLSHDRHVIQ